jgi:energy-coupling factor transport system permease protein
VTERLPRPLHPGAWWLWALGMATAASRTTNPLNLLVLASASGCVVAFRRTDAVWARGFAVYLKIGLTILAIRVVFRAVFDAQHGTTILFTLPQIDLPDRAAGIRIGGPVSAQGVLSALYDGIRLATLLLCLGAANVLANPKRLLKALPGALHELGVAVTVGLTIAPQMIESAHRIRRARRLRPTASQGRHRRRRTSIVLTIVAVLEDALDRSLVLAAAMDSRGYGRSGAVTRSSRTITGGLMLAGVCGLCVGVYGVLDGTTPRPLGVPMLVAGCLFGVAGIRLGGRRVDRTVYRPDPWTVAEWSVVACGVGAATLMFVAEHVDPGNLFPTVQPLRWPELGLIPALAGFCGVLPAWLAPPVAVAERAGVARDVAVVS